MKSIKRYFQLWNKWQKISHKSMLNKILVLFHLRYSLAFEILKICDGYDGVVDFRYDKEDL
jgi:hypothetical protein